MIIWCVTILVCCQGRLEQPSSVDLGVRSVLVLGLSVESSCPGSAPQVWGVCTWPCVSALGSRAAAGVAAELPSGVGEVFGQHSALDLGMAGQGKGLRFQLHDPETSYVVGGYRLAASLGARLEDRT